MEYNENSLKKKARKAGFLYLIWALTGIYGMVIIPSIIKVNTDIVGTTNRILANEFIFRTNIINNLISSIICIFLLMALYKLFKNVNKTRAKLMVALLIVTIPVVFITEALNISILMILKGEILRTFEITRRQDLAMLLLKINDYTAFPLEMFWGLWLIPFGQLVYRSEFIPRIFGIFLLLNGAAYIIHSIVSILFPDIQIIVTQFTMPFLILGEISITGWLLIKGAELKTEKVEQ